jgi:phage gp29-like protein
MNTSRQLTLRARSTAIFAAVRQFGSALRGQPAITALARPVIADFTPMLWAGRRMTPDQIRWILQAAVGGNIQEQWALFDLMEDTWPRLAKNLNEVRRAAARTTYAVQPYAERGQKPTDDALARADVVEAALKNWRPQPGTLELSLEDGLYNALDAFGKGLSVLEVTWQRNDSGLLPRCAHLLHPRRYGWNADGNELGLVNAGAADPGYRSSALSDANWQPFPPGQFWVGIWHARSGAPGQTALLRCLAPYWVGITFGWEWLLSNAQIFGVPIRWGTYDVNRPELRDQLAEMLANLGSAGWAAFPSGTTLDLKEAISRSTDNPQVMIQTLADKAADLLILGQEASSESKPAGLGSGASQLHGSVRADVLQNAAQWCADLLNYQLVPALLRWNWGDESDPPTIVPDIASENDPKAKADRDDVLSKIAPLPRKWFYERHAIPEPEADEETVGGPGTAPNPNPPPPGGPSSGSSAPGGGADAVPPGSGDAPGIAQARLAGDKTAGRAIKARSVNPPRSAVPPGVALNARKAGQEAIPGDYRMPEATKRALADAHARDFAPLRKAAEPLLAAIEAGNLDVVGELEAFIARLDAMAPGMVGASELADALEAALAEAAIVGAAQSYGKISTVKIPNSKS